MKIENIPHPVLRGNFCHIVENVCGFDCDDHTPEQEAEAYRIVETYTPKQLHDNYCSWEGIRGYEMFDLAEALLHVDPPAPEAPKEMSEQEWLASHAREVAGDKQHETWWVRESGEADTYELVTGPGQGTDWLASVRMSGQIHTGTQRRIMRAMADAANSK